MNRPTLMTALFLSGLALIALPGCDDKKGMEKTGERIDNTLDNDKHTLERAGEEIDESVHNKNDKIDDTIDDIRDNK